MQRAARAAHIQGGLVVAQIRDFQSPAAAAHGGTGDQHRRQQHAGRKPQSRSWRRPLAALALSVLLSTVLVASLKALSSVDCPWDLVRYGGDRVYVDIFSALLAGTPHRGCFPAGHASAGYAWLALFFFFQTVRPAWRWRGLTAGLMLGMVFGLSQQLRGAHFLSHDLWTSALCWLVAVAVHVAMGQPSQSVRASQ